MYSRPTICFQYVLSIAMLSPLAVGAERLRAGFATADLTPPLKVEMGGFGYNLGRTGDAVRDKLLARAAVLEFGPTRVAIVGCDLGGISLRITQKVRSLVADAIGIPPESIMIGTTHTHSAPVAAEWIGVGKPDPAYQAELPSRIAEAILDASKKIEPVSVYWGTAPVEGVARNREYPDGPVDTTVRVLKFTRASGEIAGFVANYSVHPVVMAQLTRMFTGDLAGVSVNLVTDRHPGSVGIFLQGSCGDINPIYAHMPQDESLQKLDLLASRLASAISGALENSKPEPVSMLVMKSQRIALPLVAPEKATVVDRWHSAEQLLKKATLPAGIAGELQFRVDSGRAVFERFNHPPLDEKSTEVQAVSLGRVVIVANPGETFLQFGEETAAELPGYKVMVTGYTNDYVGYIPRKDRYVVQGDRELSYPAYLTPWINGEFRFREDVGDVLVRDMVMVSQRVTASGAARE
jgi:hypothetical protein